jgi:tRNA-5-taurinomethyluridine 2-sulfurtransferase
VCRQAGVDLRVVPLTDAYWGRVVQHSITEIRAGRTPNPDMLCNSRVKFGAFLEYLEKEHAGEFDRVASGHYARVLRGHEGGAGSGNTSSPAEARLALTADAVKDQTYFLAHLSPAQLSRAMFPLGPLTKPEVRDVAALLDLPNKARKDSQGICFLGKVKFPEFVREHLGTWPGVFVEEETGALAGYHDGFWFYTVGQRQGIRLPGGPWYVTRKDVDHNVVYVSRQYYGQDRSRREFRCGAFSWTGARRPQVGTEDVGALQVKVRHGPNLYGCTFAFEEGNGEVSAVVRLDRDDQGLAPGQYAVFYQGGDCLGCGVIL